MNKTTAIVFFGILIIGLVISLVSLNTCGTKVEVDEALETVAEKTEPEESAEDTKQDNKPAETTEEKPKGKAKSKAKKETSQEPTAEVPKNEGFSSPEEAMKALSEVVAAKDIDTFADFVGSGALPESVRPRVAEIIEDPSVTISPTKPFTEISKSADSVRWALNFESETTDGDLELYADLSELEGDSFTFRAIRLPLELAAGNQAPEAKPKMKGKAGGAATGGEATDSPPVEQPDAVTVAHAFAKAIVDRNFELARALADPEAVTDERVAALMIAVEEGDFALREDRPLVVTLSRDDITWVLSRIQSEAASSEFAIELGKVDEAWMVNGLTFSKVLSALAQAAGGGSVAYSPIVEDPEGGDSLVLYFEFDQSGVTTRGNRQLAIVADILSQGPERVIRINGHADSMGSDDYNERLSNERADSIRKALISMGVAPDQVVTEAFGETKPRRPNFNPDGSDNPTGRSENRRAEVYLDF